ncbi:MAG: DUF3601 domain-containing protein [Saprospiraceae bacterium]
MSNALGLISGSQYTVIKSFSDYYRILHPVGETWTFVRSDFLPYEDGLTLFVIPENSAFEISFHLQWRSEQQGEIIDHFQDYVSLQNIKM